jgi:hypothetical protein
MDKQHITVPQMAGEVHIAVFTANLAVALLAADNLEIGALPAGCKLVRASLRTENMTAASLDVGFMSGKYRDDTSDRTVGDELFAGTGVNDDRELGVHDALAIAATDDVRGIGVTFNADEAADDTKTIELIIEYRA